MSGGGGQALLGKSEGGIDQIFVNGGGSPVPPGNPVASIDRAC